VTDVSNLSDITSKFRFVAMFVTVDLDMIFHSQYTYVWPWPICTKFHVSNSSVYSAVAIRLETK
jgi:hypothetical protein